MIPSCLLHVIFFFYSFVVYFNSTLGGKIYLKTSILSQPTSPKRSTICNRLSRKSLGAFLPSTDKLTLGSRFVCLFFSHLQLSGASRWVGLSGRSGAGLHTITILWLITSHFHVQYLSRSPIFSFKIDRFYLHFYPAFISP